MTMVINGEVRKLTKRQERAFTCVNMREGGYCGSTPEGAPNRICYILRNTKDGDFCPFRGIYGFHTKEGETK